MRGLQQYVYFADDYADEEGQLNDDWTKINNVKWSGWVQASTSKGLSTKSANILANLMAAKGEPSTPTFSPSSATATTQEKAVVNRARSNSNFSGEALDFVDSSQPQFLSVSSNNSIKASAATGSWKCKICKTDNFVGSQFCSGKNDTCLGDEDENSGGGKRRTMKKNRKKTIRKNKKPIRKNKKTRKYKS
jgi:hypothetical protein